MRPMMGEGVLMMRKEDEKVGRIEALLKKGKTPNAGASRSDECLAERILVGIAQRRRKVD